MKPYTKQLFGRVNEQEVWLYTLTTNQNVSVSVMTYGATLVRYVVSDNCGHFDNIVVAPNNFEEFIDNSAKWGATIGPVAGRIAHGSFELNSKQYQLEKNNNGNHLHGGANGLDSLIFDVVEVQNNRVILTIHRKNMVDGYPGNRQFTVQYELLENGELSIEYEVVSDKDTLVNMTNHAYFNLSGDVLAPITNHYLKVNASAVTQLKSDGIPTGQLLEDVPFLKSLQQGAYLSDIIQSNEPQIVQFSGVDHGFYCKDNTAKCQLYHEHTNRLLQISSTTPAVVIYTANFVDEQATINGIPTIQHNGIALEMQQLPDAIHHNHFGNVVLKAHAVYKEDIRINCIVVSEMPFEH